VYFDYGYSIKLGKSSFSKFNQPLDIYINFLVVFEPSNFKLPYSTWACDSSIENIFNDWFLSGDSAYGEWSNNR